MLVKTKKASMAFAEVHSNEVCEDAILGYGSVEMDNEEAGDVLARVLKRHRLDDAAGAAAKLFAPPDHRAAIEEIVLLLEGRYLAGAVREYSNLAVMPNVTLQQLGQHQSAWGRKRRLIEVTCQDSEAMRAFAGRFEPQGWPYGDAACILASDGSWEAWRLAGPVLLKPVEESAALQLAQVVASVAVAVAASRSKGFDGVEYSYERSLERHHIGEWNLYPLHYPTWEADSYMPINNEIDKRLATWDYACKTDDHPNETMRIAARIKVDDLEDRRDRLLMMMLGANLDVETVLGLRICGFDLDLYGNLYDVSRPGLRDLLLEMPFVDDLWALVHASDSLDGFLIGRIGDGIPYGRRRLDEKDVAAIIERRRLCLDICFDGAVTATHPLDGRL